MIEIKDQLGNNIKLNSSPKRIISLVPSQTELLFDLGLDKEVVGITKFCVHPKEWRKTKTIVGGTKKLHHDKIDLLNPDLIIANKEENTKEDIEKLQSKYQVYVSDIYSIQDCFEMINDVGELVCNIERSKSLVNSINKSVQALSKNKFGTAAYFIWKNPYMLAGANTFINEMLETAGFSNIINDEQSRYPEISIDQLKSLKPKYLLLSTEPFPFNLDDVQKLEAETGIKTLLVDGEMFSWYGSRLEKFGDYILDLMP